MTKQKKQKSKLRNNGACKKINKKQKQLEHLSDLVKNKKYNCMHKPTKYKKHLKRN